MAWLQGYTKNHSSTTDEDVNNPRAEDSIVENIPLEPEQPQPPRGSWVYRRMRAVFEASHRAPDRANGLPESLAAEEIIDQDEDERDSSQQRSIDNEVISISSGESEENFPNADDNSLPPPDADESLDVSDARQVSDSETSNTPSDNTSNDDITSESTRVTDIPKMSEVSSKVEQDEDSGTLDVEELPQGEREAPKRAHKSDATKDKIIHHDSGVIQKTESKATEDNMLHICQKSPSHNGIDEKFGGLLMTKKTVAKPHILGSVPDENPASDGHSVVDLVEYVGTRAAASIPMEVSSGTDTKVENTAVRKISEELLKKAPESVVASASQEYIPEGDRKPAAIPRPMVRDLEICESKMSGKRKRFPEPHAGSHAHLSKGLPLQIEFKAPNLSLPASTERAFSRDPSSLATDSHAINSMNQAKKGKRRLGLIYKTCRDTFSRAEVEDIQRTIPPKEESYFSTRKKRIFQVAILSKESAMMMDQLEFGLPKDCDPSMHDVREIIGGAMRGALHSTAKWEFFIPDSGAYIKKDLESMISLRDYLDECGLGEHISARIVSENGPAVFKLSRTSERDTLSGEGELLFSSS